MLCWDFEWAPKIAKQVTAEMFSPEYRLLARIALAHIARYGEPPRGRLRDYVDDLDRLWPQQPK